MARVILITGANKGIGLALAARCVRDHDDTHVVLACRSALRGEAAAKSIGERCSVLELDVSSADSVTKAAAEFRKRGQKLYALVNNAGVVGSPEGGIGNDAATIFECNTRGPKRVTDAFLPHLAEGGRVVMISSGAAPQCVSKSSAARQKLFTDPAVTWAAVEAAMAAVSSTEDLEKEGFGGALGCYGMSKALLNCLTVIYAREGVNCNACTPGMIGTDLVYDVAPWYVPKFLLPTLAKYVVGARTPDEGTVAPLHLLFGDLEGKGRFYGSDALRSPLDVYRKPGTPAYEGP